MRRAVAARGSSYLRKAAPADGREFVGLQNYLQSQMDE